MFKLLVTLAVITTVLSEDVVNLKQGQIRGHRLKTRKGRDILAFQGIPYAKPPVGDLRFKPPQPVKPWEGVRDAIKESADCLQGGLFLQGEMIGDEDCLYLNVYAPKLESPKPLDVMFWIHGGGWQSGTGSTEYYGPQYLLDKDVILVTINYRLGPLGFLSTADAVCPGNNGLKDQVAALRWVQENIEAFGGNPKSVTIFGESAGGASVQYHMISPLSKGLFTRGISQSGTALCLWAFSPNATTRYQAEKLATLVDCPTQPSEALVSCLKKKDAKEIVSTTHSFLEWNIDPMIPYKPVVEHEVSSDDSAFLVESPIQTLLSSKAEDLPPWMVGFLSADGAIITSSVYGNAGLVEELNERFDEIIPMAMYFRETAPKTEHKKIAQKIKKFYFGDKPITIENSRSLTNLYTDSFFLAGIDASIKLHLKGKSPVYYFYIDYRGTNSFTTKFGDPVTDYGPGHLDELMYLFPENHHFPGTKMSAKDEKMIDTMTTLWTNFAIYGNPTPEKSEFNTWSPVSSAKTMEYAKIKHDGFKLKQNPTKDRAKFWSKLPHKALLPKPVKEEL